LLTVRSTLPLPPRYENPRLLGEGSFARVYAADDSVLGRVVAVKVLRDELRHEPATVRRFAREVRIAALLDGHPNIVTVHDAGVSAGLPWLVLELLTGSVAERLRERVPEPLALRWVAQTAAALDFAHSRGIVHRDVKPSNLLLDARGDVRLADFGVAFARAVDETFTMPGAVVGSPGYLAPEVAAGGRATAAADVYSLAVVARELLGHRAALERALATRPEDRPAAGELAAALGGGDAPTDVQPRTRRMIARIPRTAIPRPAVAPRRHRAVRTGVVAIVLAAVAAGSAAGGALVARRATASPHAVAHAIQPPQTCTLSPFDHDANIVVRGVTASAFCRAQSHALRLDGYHWTYRAGHELIAPDHGGNSLVVVCRLRRNRMAATVYDSGTRAIGTKLCGWYASAEWHRA